MYHSYKELCTDMQLKYGVRLKTIKAIDISAMIYGHLAFDIKDNQLVPFRTWRHTMTEEAAPKLTELFSF